MVKVTSLVVKASLSANSLVGDSAVVDVRTNVSSTKQSNVKSQTIPKLQYDFVVVNEFALATHEI